MTPRHVDFAKKPGQPWQGWLLLLLGAGLLAGTWLSKRHWQEKTQAIQSRLDQTDREQERRQSADRARAALTPAQARRLAQWTQQRAWPWPAALQTVDAVVAEPVYLLGMGLQPNTETGAGLLKLEAQAPSGADALAFVERLRQAQALVPQALGRPQLSSQQQALDAGTNAPVVRFVVTVPMNLPPPESRARP